jgi:hypothetical protein
VAALLPVEACPLPGRSSADISMMGDKDNQEPSEQMFRSNSPKATR